jgi:hypothetical protein
VNIDAHQLKETSQLSLQEANFHQPLQVLYSLQISSDTNFELGFPQVLGRKLFPLVLGHTPPFLSIASAGDLCSVCNKKMWHISHKEDCMNKL